MAIFLAIDGPPDQAWLPWMVWADHLWHHRWSPLATDGPPLENHPGSFMMVLRAAYCKVQSLAVMFQLAGFDYCMPEVDIALDIASHG